MLMKHFSFIFLVVPLLPADVSGQALSWNKTATKKYCLSFDVLEGDKMTLYAVLDTTQYNTTGWTSVGITLQYTPPSSWKTICEMNITRGVCPVPEQGVCGYCDRLDGDIYYLAFNVIVSANGTSQVRYRIMANSTFGTINSNLYFQVLGIPTAKTLVNYGISYRANNITSDAFVHYSNSTSVYTAYSSLSNISYRFNDQTSSSVAINTYTVFYNTTQWDRNMDTVLQVNMTDQCFRNWSFTIPVTNRPDYPECEPPVLYRTSLNGTQIVTRCRYSKLASVIEEQSTLSFFPTFYPFYPPYTINTGGEWDIKTFTVTINSSNFSPSQTATINVYANPVTDISYINNTRKIPRVTRFNVNGSKSIIVNEGAVLTFECKVYGNPKAVAVLGGTDGGKIQEERSSTDLLLFTLAKVRCEDSGRYSCKGVNEFDSTPNDRQGFVDVNVKCSPFVKSHVPSNSNRKFIFDPGSNILVTLEVFGYPVPAEFGLKLEQGSTFSNLSQDQYSVSSVVLNPSFALITLRIFTRNNTGSQSFIFTISNGANSSLDFKFQIERSGIETPYPEEPSTSPWMPAFIAVICVAGVAVIVAVVVYVIKKRYHNKGMTSRELSGLNIQTSSTQADGRQAKVVTAPQSGERTTPADKHTYRNVDPTEDPSMTPHYDTTAGYEPSTTQQYRTVETSVDEQIYENVQDNLYEFP